MLVGEGWRRLEKVREGKIRSENVREGLRTSLLVTL
jgi:hypothetical protein